MATRIKRHPILTIAILLALLCTGFFAVHSYAATWTILTPNVTPVVVSAGGGAQSNAATITSAVGKTVFLEGFDVTGGGATAASVIEVSTTGLSNNLKFEIAIAAGITAPFIANTGVYSVRFPTPIPASATNTNIVVTCPSFGSGNTNAAITAYGFIQ